MKIKQETLKLICFQLSDLSRETGGILGSTDGKIVDRFVADKPNVNFPPCVYSPDVKFFNDIIEKWTSSNITFMGLLHTHIGGAKSLSVADKGYAKMILGAMPSDFKYLYFPLFVLPEKELVCYRCNRSSLEFVNEKTEIITV